MPDVPEDPGNTGLSPDVLLRRAAQGDAARATELLAYVGPTKLLDAVLTQAELAVDEDRPRSAGIDAIAELDRASIEVMGLPQGADLDLGQDGAPWSIENGSGRSDTHDIDGSGERADGMWLADDGVRPPEDALFESPVLIGWELTTVVPDDLPTAVLTLAVRPWHLALVAFGDRTGADGRLRRRVVAAAADGRLIAAELCFPSEDGDPDDPDVLGATVSRDPRSLGASGDLAASLRAALRSAARGPG